MTFCRTYRLKKESDKGRLCLQCKRGAIHVRTGLPRKHRPGKMLASAQGVNNLPHRIALEGWWRDTPGGGFDIRNILHMTLQKMP